MEDVMVFSSVIFLFYFLPALIIIYKIVPHRFKNGVMILGSFVFYAWGEIRFIPVLIALSIIDYNCAHKMEKYRDNKNKRLIFFLIGLCSNLGVLIFFKYTNFLVANVNTVFGLSIPDPHIMLPIGVSFNSFQEMSYCVDSYRGTTKPEKKYFNYLCYTTLFPQIIAGPIVRYVTVGDDLKSHDITRDNLSAGMRRLLTGLGKKVLIANNVGLLWKEVSSGGAGEATVLLLWLGIIAYHFQIYFDFSGYSDMAIGAAKIFGLTFDENFNTPYIAKSITEFWQRWHMTLSRWFRDYVYIPLGGNRRGMLRQMFNIFTVWALTGLWHGAAWNFVLWGLYFAVLLTFEKFVLFRFWDKVPALLRHVYTMFIVLMGWLIFASDDLKVITLSGYVNGMFGLNNLPLYNSKALFLLVQYAFIFAVAAYLSTPHFKTHVIEKAEKTESRIAWGAAATAYLLVFIACVAAIVNSSYNPFLYARF